MPMANDILSHYDIESSIVALMDRGDELVDEVRDAAVASGRADAAYKSAYARALLRATGPNRETRDAKATLEVEEIYEHRRITEALLLAAREAANNNRTKIDALRTLAVSHRAASTGH